MAAFHSWFEQLTGVRIPDISERIAFYPAWRPGLVLISRWRGLRKQEVGEAVS